MDLHHDHPPAMDQSMVCMSVIEDGPRIAFAAYNEESNIITMEEVYSNGYEVQNVVEKVLAIVQPTLLLVSNQIVSNENLIDVLTRPPATLPQEHETDSDADDNDSSGPSNQPNNKPSSIPYKTLKTSSFDVRNCKALILQKLCVRSFTRNNGSMPPPVRPPERSGATPLSDYHALATVIDFESKLQIQALGSLLSFLSTTVFGIHHHSSSNSSNNEGHGGEEPMIAVSDVVQANSSMFMNISSETLSALNIFSTEHHPMTGAKGYGNSKEGFSVFSLLDRTKSRSGRERLREWMLKPLIDCDAIRRRQDGVELFLLPDFAEARSHLLQLLSNVAPVSKILSRVQKCCARPHDFVSLVRSLDTASRIFQILRDQVLWNLQQLEAVADQGQEEHENEHARSESEKVVSFLDFIESALHRSKNVLLYDLADRLKEAIDLEASGDCHSVIIRDGYDRHLDELKQQYAHLSDTLTELGRELSRRFPDLGEYMDVIFLPQIGFHIRLTNEEQLAANEELVPPEFDFIFSENGSVYFKGPDTRKLDSSIGDIDGLIKDREAIILAGLEDLIVEYDLELQTTFGVLADLDCILSFGSCALELNYARPTVVDSSEYTIEIKNGRHPLQELLLKSSFVPNDTSIDVDTRLNVLTGPNFSGKSCYARQIGIIVFMAQIGSFVPCDAAYISIHDKLFARFTVAETCSVPQSSFQYDLSQLGAILRRAGPSSLVLIDEFGKGTSPASGIALLAAALKKLAESRAVVVCTTHFLEIFSMGILTDGEGGCKATQMAVQIPETNKQQAFPLFRLQQGVASSSAGLVCAEMAGVRRAILDRAFEIVEATKKGQQVKPLTEILRDCLNFSEVEKRAVIHFVQTDWNTATVADMNLLLDLATKI